jgi:hypothetical protein
MIDFPANPTTGQVFSAGNYAWQFDGVHWVSMAPLNPASNPNKLINPFLEIDQANEGAAVALTTSSTKYTADGFQAGYVNTTAPSGIVTRDTNTPPPGYGYSIVLQTNVPIATVGVGDWMAMAQVIEADDLYDTAQGTVNARPLTLSFWFLATIAGTYYVSIHNQPTTVSYIAPFAIATANVWQFFTITIPGNTAAAWSLNGNGPGALVYWVLAAGTNRQAPTLNNWVAGNFLAGPGMNNAIMTTANAYGRLGPCKLEVGSVATPMLRRSIQEELSRCQRYYEKSYDVGTAVGTATGANTGWFIVFMNNLTAAGRSAGGSTSFKVTKRASPTITMYSGVTGAAGVLRDEYATTDVTANLNAHNSNLFGVYGTTTYSGAVQFNAHWVADARL